jgi:hypothetical protein
MADDQTGGAPPTSAAAELFSDRPTPSEPPAGFLNPAAGNYVDQRGMLRYHRSNDQLAEDRKAWIDGFDQAKRRNGFSKDEPAERYSDEAREAHIAKFDAAARADGYEPVEPPSPAEQHAADLHLIHWNAKPSDYKVDLSSLPGADPRTGPELQAMFADLEFRPEIGSSVIDRIIKLSSERKNLVPEARDAIARQDRAELLRRYGGNETEMNEQKAMVAELLRSVRGPGAQLAQALANDVVIANDWQVHKSLVNHADRVGRFYRSRTKQ